MAKASKIIAERIGGKLRQLGISQAELARKTGTTPAFILKLLQGKADNPGLVNLEAIADVLGISLAELVTDPADFRALKTHTALDCVEVVRDLTGLLKTGKADAALELLGTQPKKRT